MPGGFTFVGMGRLPFTELIISGVIGIIPRGLVADIIGLFLFVFVFVFCTL
jgi:hypothetical protein